MLSTPCSSASMISLNVMPAYASCHSSFGFVYRVSELTTSVPLAKKKDAADAYVRFPCGTLIRAILIVNSISALISSGPFKFARSNLVCSIPTAEILRRREHGWIKLSSHCQPLSCCLSGSMLYKYPEPTMMFLPDTSSWYILANVIFLSTLPFCPVQLYATNPPPS